MTELKREYVVPLRRKTRTAPKWRRSKKAISVLNDFIKKHMKTEDVIICKELNEKIWERGIKNPPGKVSVVAVRLQINEGYRTLVNLSSVGIKNQLEVYNLDKKKEKSQTKKNEEIIDTEVKEISKEKIEEKNISEKIDEKEVNKNE